MKTEAYIPGIVFEFSVFGSTTVKVTEARFILRPVPAKQVHSLEPNLPDPPDYTGAITDPIVDKRIVLPPNAVVQIRENLHGLGDDALNDLINGKAILCGYGFIKYIDAFGKERETATCYVYDFAWGGVFRTTDGVVLNPPGFKVGGPKSYHRTT